MENLNELAKAAKINPDVKLIGRGTDWPPITAAQWRAVMDATQVLSKAGLSTSVTNFWSVSEPERTEIINKRYTEQGKNQSIG